MLVCLLICLSKYELFKEKFPILQFIVSLLPAGIGYLFLMHSDLLKGKIV